MSYILDALKAVEGSRQTGTLPSMLASPAHGKRTVRRSPLTLAITVVGLAVATVALAIVLTDWVSFGSGSETAVVAHETGAVAEDQSEPSRPDESPAVTEEVATRASTTMANSAGAMPGTRELGSTIPRLVDSAATAQVKSSPQGPADIISNGRTSEDDGVVEPITDEPTEMVAAAPPVVLAEEPKTFEPALARREPEVSRSSFVRPHARSTPVSAARTKPIAPALASPNGDKGFRAAALPTAHQLSSPAREALPDINITVHSHTPNASSRFIRVNGRMVREGGSVSDGLTVASITPSGVVFRQGDVEFFMPRDGRWSNN